MIAQGIIMIGGAATIGLLAQASARARLIGHGLGILVQPFWLWENYQAGQWGMFALGFWYTLMYAHGVRTSWREMRRGRRKIEVGS
jgi:hypothetical protein